MFTLRSDYPSNCVYTGPTGRCSQVCVDAGESAAAQTLIKKVRDKTTRKISGFTSGLRHEGARRAMESRFCVLSDNEDLISDTEDQLHFDRYMRAANVLR